MPEQEQEQAYTAAEDPGAAVAEELAGRPANWSDGGAAEAGHDTAAEAPPDGAEASAAEDLAAQVDELAAQADELAADRHQSGWAAYQGYFGIGIHQRTAERLADHAERVLVGMAPDQCQGPAYAQAIATLGLVHATLLQAGISLALLADFQAVNRERARLYADLRELDPAKVYGPQRTGS